MDFVSVEFSITFSVIAPHVFYRLRGPQNRLNIQHSEPGNRLRWSLQPLRIVNFRAQHLIATAKTYYPAASPHVSCQIEVPPIVPQCRQVADGILGAGQNHNGGITW